MITEKNSKLFRVLAGALFLVNLFAGIILKPVSYYYVWSLFELDILPSITNCLLAISRLLVAVGFFTSSRKIITSGAVLCIVYRLTYLIANLYFEHRIEVFDLRATVLDVILLFASVLFLIAIGKKGRYVLPLSAVSAGMVFINCVVCFISDFNSYSSFILPLVMLVVSIPWIAGYLLAGLALSSDWSKQNAVEKASSPQDSAITVEKLTKLKALLDSGAITQEEFDAKKSEIMKL